MRKALMGFAAGSLLAASVTVSFAQSVNCALVNKNLQSGRTEQEVAETMVISVDDVKKCKEMKKDAAPAAAPVTGEKPAAAPAGAGASGAGTK